jgi:dTDP-4-amino-4,6-dideoxygalactose transaminase
MCGQPCDMQAIHALSLKYGFKIIEDASHAIGARYQGEPVGNGRYSDLTVFSFHPVKIITTGEGGMVLCNSNEYAQTLNRLRSHGISSDQSDMQLRPVDEIWNYQQLQLGFNHRMTEMQAALGLSQLKQLDAVVLKRHALAAVYDKALQGLPLNTPWQHPDSYSSYHLYAVLIPKTEDGPSQQLVYRAMHDAGIQVNLHYIPVYLQPFYAAMGFKRGYCPKAESYFKQAISLPLHTGLTPEQQFYVNSLLMNLLKTEKQTTAVHA